MPAGGQITLTTQITPIIQIIPIISDNLRQFTMRSLTLWENEKLDLQIKTNDTKLDDFTRTAESIRNVDLEDKSYERRK